MRWLLRLSALVTVIALLPAAASTYAESAPAPASESLFQDAICTTICAKSGVNTAWPVLIPKDDYTKYPRARRVGMGWMLELVLDDHDLTRTVEAFRFAQEHDLEFMVIPQCEDDTCPFINVNTYANFLSDVTAQVDGVLWAMAGPNEPEFWGDWLASDAWVGAGNPGSDPAVLAAYMNTLIARRDADIPNVRLTSPGFNLSNPYTFSVIDMMESAGADFVALDSFAGTSYTTAGNGAYYYYASPAHHDPPMRSLVESYGKKFLFIEFGDDGLAGKPGEGNPDRQPIIQHMQTEFEQAANDPTVEAILYFDAFGHNPEFAERFELYDSEITYITQGTACAGSTYNDVGIGVHTDQSFWRPVGQSACQSFEYGCPYKDGAASVCPVGLCVDNDGDTFYGDGNGCQANDCDDSDPTSSALCNGGLPDAEATWGTVRTVDYDVSAAPGQLWPSIQIRQDGLPIIAYHRGTLRQGELSAMDCTSLDCASGVRRDLTHTQHTLGTFLSMVLKSDGSPLVTHLDQSYDELELFDCHDPGCLSGDNRIIDPDSGVFADLGYATSMALRGDPTPYPVIAYWNYDSGELRFVDCANTNCSSGWMRSLDGGQETGYWPSVIIGQDDSPLIAYTRLGQPGGLMLFDCDDGGCQSGAPSALDSPDARSYWPHAMARRSNGLPVIVYLKSDTQSLTLFACSTSNCSSGTQTRLYPGFGNITSASIALMDGDRPFIAFSEEIDGDNNLLMLACADPVCGERTMTIYTEGNAGAQPDVAIKPDGNPLIAFHDVGNGALMVYSVEFQPPSTNQPPSATPGGPYAVDEGASVSLDGSGSGDPDGDPLAYAWDLDHDGIFETSGENPTFSAADYDGPTSQTVALRVCDAGPLCASGETTVEVHNVAPSVEAGPDVSVGVGGTVSFSGSLTDPAPADTHTVTWDFDDGQTATGDLAPTHGYAAPGSYVVTLTVEDDDGGVGSDTLTVSVSVDVVNPIVGAGPDQTVNEGDAVSFNGGITDPGSGSNQTIAWDFGDGQTASGNLTPTHTYADDGNYTVSLTVTADDGGSATDSLFVTVNNVAPVVDVGADQTVDEGVEASFSGSFTDPGTADTHTITWDFGDGTTASDTLTPAHSFATPGSYTVILTVEDDGGGVGTDTLTVNVDASDPPEPAVCEAFPLIYYAGAIAADGTRLDDAQGGDTFTVGLGAGDGNRYNTLEWNGFAPGSAVWKLGVSLGWPGIQAGQEPVGNATDLTYGFVNPLDGSDHSIDVGDWVMRGPVSIGVGSDPGLAIANHVAEGRVLRVLVFDADDHLSAQENQAGGSGSRVYHISDIMLVKIINFQGSHMTIEFVDSDSNCGT